MIGLIQSTKITLLLTMRSQFLFISSSKTPFSGTKGLFFLTNAVYFKPTLQGLVSEPSPNHQEKRSRCDNVSD